jgi:hypothetical protein
MSKLPAEFVKAPATQPKQPRARRTRKASLISPDPVRDPRELMLQLTEEEYEALEAARQKLVDGGAEVTLEQMIHRVFADWMLRLRTPAPAPAAHTIEQTKAQTPPPRDEHVIARLRAFVAAPMRMWRELGTQMWRMARRS